MKKMFSELQVQCEIVILMESYDKLLCLWFHYAIKCSLFFQIYLSGADNIDPISSARPMDCLEAVV